MSSFFSSLRVRRGLDGSIFRRRTPEKARHLRGMARVAGYFSVVTLVCGVVSIRHARAEYQNQTLLFGRQMLELAKASNHEVTKIVFNGQPVHVGTSVTEDPPEKVLGRYEEYCKANRGQLDDFLDVEGAKANPDAPKADRKADGDSSALAKAGFVRAEDEKDGSGTVVCFVKGPRSKSTTKEAFESFMATGELGAFGELRFAYANKGPSGKTLVLTAWTDSAFNLRDMMPEDGQDAPGEDFPEIPRVPSSTRVMSAKAAGTPYAVNVYKTTDAPAKTLEFFDKEMKARGWFTYDPEMNEAEDKGLGRAYMKNAVVLTVGTSKQDDGNFVALGLAGVSADDRLGRR
jgi:hypothetical protein